MAVELINLAGEEDKTKEELMDCIITEWNWQLKKEMADGEELTYLNLNKKVRDYLGLDRYSIRHLFLDKGAKEICVETNGIITAYYSIRVEW